MTKRFHAMVKPAGSLCNLNCAYCFYLHKQDILHQPRLPRMSDSVLESHIAQYILAQTGEKVVFSWQGGEPALCGLDFFRKAIVLQKRHRKPGQSIENDLQTNGLLLNEEWARFLKENNFLVGLSVDGPKRLHDRYRVTKGGGSTHDRVMAAARLLRKFAVPFNALCVVNNVNSQFPFDVYRFLTRELGAPRVQFIPCVEPKSFHRVAPQRWDEKEMPFVGTPASKPGTPDSVVTEWSVDPQDWGRFLTKTWDDWFQRDYGKVHVDLFETAVAQFLGMPAQRCVTAEFCGKALAIEHDGDVFSCDHYVYPDYRLGNIKQTSWEALAFGQKQMNFGFAKRDTLPGYCRACSFLTLCWGECPKNRFVRTPSGEAGLNFLCPGFKMFYNHAQRDMPEIKRRIDRNR